MENKEYKQRLIDKNVENYLDAFGALLIEGPKWCGKTWTAEHHCNSTFYLEDPRNSFQNRRLAEIALEDTLEGDIPRLIDEWQEVPEYWDAIRYRVDKDTRKGQFILTGSTTVDKDRIRHSGAGRIAKLRMRPMSLYESGHSSGDISLEKLCCGNIKTKLTGEVKLKDLIDLVVRGGWPANQSITIEKAGLLPKEYIKAILDNDIYKVDHVKRDRHKMELLLKSLARNESTTVTNKKLKNDIKEIDDEDISRDTVADYMNVLDKLFLLDNQKPYGSSLRSSVRVKQAEKRHFVDPSLAVALLNATPDMLMNDLNTFGFLFESLVERDLRIYAESFDAKLYHYQDYTGKEIDAIVELPDGEWCGFEIKLGAGEIDDGAQSLLNVKKEILKDKKKAPRALCVICGMSNAAYKREDGVFVVPITALKN